MEFYTSCREKRPVRLSEETRRFAWESLHGRYGDEAMKTPCVNMDGTPGFELLSDYQKYDAIIAKIVAEAPLGITEHEKLSGSATLGAAIWHMIPASFNGKLIFGSVSHLTLGFEKALRLGFDVMEADIDKRLADASLSDYEREIIQSMKNAVGAFRVWHGRYLAALKETKQQNYTILQNVPFKPAKNFREAVQSLWFTFAFTRLCGNWPGIGRIDEMLGGFLHKDLQNGILTLDEAREFLSHFFIKGCEWVRSDAPAGSGDAQHYQNIVLGGVDREGNEVANEVTYLVLDIVEELPIGDFPITVRLNKNTPPKLFRRIAEVMRHGGGVVAVYNEDLILESLTNFGYPLREARQFANDGCWEVQIPGKTYFSYCSFDALRILLNDTLKINGEGSHVHAHFDTFDELYAAFKNELKKALEWIYSETVRRFTGKSSSEDWRWQPNSPCSVISLLTEGCLESGKSYLCGGAVYTVVSPHIGGAPDVGNCLHAIKKLVFEERRVTFDELMKILSENWEGSEELRCYVRNSYTYYGNDDDEADAHTVKVLNDFAELAKSLNDRSPILFPPGVSTFGRQIEWAPYRAAVPFGFRANEILSGNTSPTPGTDVAGATAVIKSYCKTDLRRQTTGAALDLKLHPSAAEGVNGVAALTGLIRGFLELGGYFMQIDVTDTETLKRAQEHPEDFKTLSVRVSGWNARFTTLDRQWQDMIIGRSEQGI